MSFIISIITICLIGALTSVKGTKIAVLGMKGAGKTRFYRFLQGKEYAEGENLQTIAEQYDGFVYKKADGTEIKIRSGYDYAGGKEVAERTNEKLIAESDTIFFIFDLYKYFKVDEYKNDTNNRLNFVIKKIDNKNLYVLGTHIDMIKSDSQLKKSKKELENYIEQNGYYEKIKQGNLALVDMTNSDELKKVVDKLF